MSTPTPKNLTPHKVAAILRTAGFGAAKRHTNTSGVKSVIRPGYRVTSTYAEPQRATGRTITKGDRVTTDIFIGWIARKPGADTSAEIDAVQAALASAGVTTERSGKSLRIPLPKETP